MGVFCQPTGSVVTKRSVAAGLWVLAYALAMGFNVKQYVTMGAPSDSRNSMRATRVKARAAADSVAVPMQPEITRSTQPRQEAGMTQKLGGFLVGGGAAFMLYLAASTTMSMLMGSSDKATSVRPGAVATARLFKSDAPMIGGQFEATNIDPSAIARSYTKPVEIVENILPAPIVASQVSAPQAVPAKAVATRTVSPRVVALNKIVPVVVAPAVVVTPIRAPAVVVPEVVVAAVVVAPAIVAPEVIAVPVAVAPAVVAPVVVAVAPEVVAPVVVVAPPVVAQQVSVSMESSSTPVVAMQADVAEEVVAEASNGAGQIQVAQSASARKVEDHMASFYGYHKTSSLYSRHH